MDKVERAQGMEQSNPFGMTVCGEEVIVTSRIPPSLYVIDFNTLVLNKKVDLQHLGVTDITGVASDEHKNMYVCDLSGCCVHVLSLKGQVKLLYSFGKDQLRQPFSICVSDGLVYVSDWDKHAVCVFDKEGKFVTSFGGDGSKEGQFSLPCGLVVDNDGILCVCDYGNNRVQLF